MHCMGFSTCHTRVSNIVSLAIGLCRARTALCGNFFMALFSFQVHEFEPMPQWLDQRQRVFEAPRRRGVLTGNTILRVSDTRWTMGISG